MAWKCPQCERVLKNTNSVHCCVKKDLNDVFHNKAPHLIYVFDKILEAVYDWRDVHISATEKCIMYVSTQTFLVVKPMKTQLNVKFYLSRETHVHPIIKVAKYGKQYEHHIRISDLDEVNDELISYIRQSYNMFKP